MCYSERDNWGHLDLYDLATGKLKNQITSGDWVVTQLFRVDEKARTLCFLADGREPGNPYFTHLYRIGFDGQGLTLLTPENANHQVTLSPSGRQFVDRSLTFRRAPCCVMPVASCLRVSGRRMFPGWWPRDGSRRSPSR